MYKDSQIAIKRIGSVIYLSRSLLLELRNVSLDKCPYILLV